jgi:hypothetical protein
LAPGLAFPQSSTSIIAPLLPMFANMSSTTNGLQGSTSNSAPVAPELAITLSSAQNTTPLGLKFANIYRPLCLHLGSNASKVRRHRPMLQSAEFREQSTSTLVLDSRSRTPDIEPCTVGAKIRKHIPEHPWSSTYGRMLSKQLRHRIHIQGMSGRRSPDPGQSPRRR